MRAAVTALLFAAVPAAAGAPLSLAERQVVTLEFDRPIVRITTTDPDLVAVKSEGKRVKVTGLKGGRGTLELTFGDGASVSYDVSVEAAHRTSTRAAGANEIELTIGHERRFRSPGVARVLVEENGVAKVSVDGETVTVVALASGQASLVVVDVAGNKTTWQVRVH